MRRYLFTSLLLVLIFTSWATAATIIVIAKELPAGAPDQALADHVAALGFDVEIHSSAEAQPLDVSGVVAVVIGEALSSGSMSDFYRDVAIPLVICESYILDEMKFSPDGTSYNGTDDMSLVIVDPDHPIAGGLTGTVEVTSQVAQIVSSPDVQGDVNIIATTEISGEASIFTYETGALDIEGVPVPGPRVFVFLHENNTEFVTDDGWGLIERSVLWAVGQLDGAAVTPEEAIATTWGDLKALY